MKATDWKAQVTATLGNVLFFAWPGIATFAGSSFVDRYHHGAIPSPGIHNIYAIACAFISYAVVAAAAVIIFTMPTSRQMPRYSRKFSDGQRLAYVIAVAIPYPLSIVFLIASAMGFEQVTLFLLAATCCYCWMSLLLVATIAVKVTRKRR